MINNNLGEIRDFMNAIIRTKTGFYCSTIFAYFNNKLKSSVVILNESGSQLIIMPINNLSKGIRRDVLIFDENMDGWIENKQWQGLDFIVNDAGLLRSIKKGLDTPLDVLNKCKDLQTTETFSGWKEINSDDDIEKLMNISVYFHDGYIENVEQDGNVLYVNFKCWSCRIIIKFVDIIESNSGEGVSWDNNCIVEAKMYYVDDYIKWVVDGFCFAECDNQECYFTSKRAQYKIELCNSF